VAEAATKEGPRSVPELTRLIKGEQAVVQVRGKDIWPRIGGYLAEMKPQIAKGKWERYIRDNFEFSVATAARYIRFHREVAANRKPTRLSDVDPPREAHHQAKGFSAWKASRQQSSTPPPRTRWDTDTAKADRPRERELGLELIEAGYRLLVQKYHPDKGGDDASFRCLTNARAKLRRCLLT
jgi:hypothetical protein